MEDAMRAITVALLATLAVPAQADCDRPGSFKLYRTSAVMPDSVYIATFDAPEGAAYNLENCTIVANRSMAQPGVVVRFWCEAVD